MKRGFYSKLAIGGIRKNKRMYLPYILTCVGMVMMFYIICFLSFSEEIDAMPGGGSVLLSLSFGKWVIGIFSLIFLFYTNSFLMRRRTKEFGLFNILGMDKNNLSKLIACESLIVSLIGLVGGLILGILFSKLAELGLLNAMKLEVDYDLTIDPRSVGITAAVYAVIFLLLFLNSVRRVHSSNPMEMLRSENAGEKPPKANWVLAVIGAVLLGAAYYIAVTIKSPLAAIFVFCVAVVMVILATYILFISGSVTLCKFLQKKKNYYYKLNHFVSVSSMAFRMKRNGAGLASICILSTMVLVTLTSTLSLYIGAEENLNTRYPHDITFSTEIYSAEDYSDENFSRMSAEINQRLPNKKSSLAFPFCAVSGMFSDAGITVDQRSITDFDMMYYEDIGYVIFISLDDYNRITDENRTLKDGECLLQAKNLDYTGRTFSFTEAKDMKLKIAGVVDNFPNFTYTSIMAVPYAILIVNDVTEITAPLAGLANYNGDPLLLRNWYCGINLNGTPEEKISAYETLQKDIDNIISHSENDAYSYQLNSRDISRNDFFTTFGSLLFIGIILSAVFVFAAMLIIYYKQISEGYEDAGRFEIMQKIGMTKKDIRKSINTQVLTVFFAPLLMAGVHLGFAFPIMWRVLNLFNLENITLTIIVTIATFLVFALFYSVIYRATSGAYYKIVSTKKEKE